MVFPFVVSNAQEFPRAIGVHLGSQFGKYVNSDMLSIIYRPKLVYKVKNTFLALVAPITFAGQVISSAIRALHGFMYNIPIAVEFGIKPTGNFSKKRV